jgi:hypothetical protein
MSSTLTIIVTGTQISPFSASDTYNVLHGGYLYDPTASPLSFFYPTSVFGGEIFSVFTESISGGDFELAYDDLPSNELILDGRYVFCDSEVIFDFSKFDQTESKIVKLVFDPKNNTEKQTFNYYISSNQIFYPNLSSIKTEYYPSQKFYTLFTPKFTIYYEDGNIVNVVVPLTSIQCGIFDFYKDKKIVDSLPLYNSKSNTLLFMNDIEKDDISLANISTDFTISEYLEENSVLQQSLGILASPISAIPLEEIKIPKPPTNENPINPPIIIGEKGLVTIFDKIDIKDISGEYLYPIGEKGKMITFDINDEIVRFFTMDRITRFP